VPETPAADHGNAEAHLGRQGGKHQGDLVPYAAGAVLVRHGPGIPRPGENPAAVPDAAGQLHRLFEGKTADERGHQEGGGLVVRNRTVRYALREPGERPGRAGPSVTLQGQQRGHVHEMPIFSRTIPR